MKALGGLGFFSPEPKCTTVARFYHWNHMLKRWEPTDTARWFFHRHEALHWVVQRMPKPRPIVPESNRWFIHEQDQRGRCRIYPIPLED